MRAVVLLVLAKKDSIVGAVNRIACRDGWKCDDGSEIEFFMVVTAQAMDVLQTQGTGSALFPRYTNNTNGRYQTQVNTPYYEIWRD
ncbi:MAG: hypothetical protein IH892_12985 [Planctomycetes bacterium]|nr:hypothetical protein [Planctomycetota bacterium]